MELGGRKMEGRMGGKGWRKREWGVEVRGEE